MDKWETIEVHKPIFNTQLCKLLFSAYNVHAEFTNSTPTWWKSIWRYRKWKSIDKWQTTMIVAHDTSRYFQSAYFPAIVAWHGFQKVVLCSKWSWSTSKTVWSLRWSENWTSSQSGSFKCPVSELERKPFLCLSWKKEFEAIMVSLPSKL